jgi:hypothetical protein
MSTDALPRALDAVVYEPVRVVVLGAVGVIVLVVICVVMCLLGGCGSTHEPEMTVRPGVWMAVPSSPWR